MNIATTKSKMVICRPLLFRLRAILILVLAFLPASAQAWTSAVPHLDDNPFTEVYFHHGFVATGPSLSKTVMPLPIGNDQFMNLAKGMAPTLTGTLTPANLSNDGFPSGVLPANIGLSQASIPNNYYGHYASASIGNAGLSVFAVPPLIVYNGGNAVLTVSPANTGVSGTGGGGIQFLPNGNWNIEFAFGDIVTTVQNSGATPGLVQLVMSTSSSLSQVPTGSKVQVHSVSGINPATVWTINRVSNTQADLQGSVWNAGMVPATGAPGTAAEMIVQVTSVTWSWLQSAVGFSNINNTISSWIFCKAADLAAVQAGQNISVAATSSMSTLAPKWARVMDMVGVQATSGQFQYLPAITAASYAANQWLPPYYGGVTAGAGDNYTVNGGPSSPVSGPYFDGEVIHFMADRSTVGRLPTLSINGRSSGAKPILLNNQNILGFNLAGQAAGSAITSISGSGTVATVTTTANHGFAIGQFFIANVAGVTPNLFNNGNALATATGVNTFTYASVIAVSGAVTGTTNPGQCKLTIPANTGLIAGNTVTVSGVGGATGCNVTTTISVVVGNTIELAGTTFGGVYTSGGNVGTSATVAGTFTPQVADGDIINLTFTASNFGGGAYTTKYYVNLLTPSYTGTTAGKILTVSAVASGRLTPGQRLTGSGLTNTPAIMPYGSAGTTGTGGTGTYALDVAPTGTTTVTGTAGSTAASCGTGLVNSLSAMSADMTCVLTMDATLGGQGYVIANNGGLGVGISYAPAATGQAVPSVSITAPGAAAEVVTPTYSLSGSITSGNLYTAQYRALDNGWVTNGGNLFVGVPLLLLKELAQKSGAGLYYNIQISLTQSSAQSLGTYLANNYGSIPIAIAIGNEMWNSGQAPNHIAQNLGSAMGFTAVNDGVYFQSVYGYYSWALANITQTIIDSYVAAGGNRNNIVFHVEFSGTDGQGCAAGVTTCAGGQTGGVQTTLKSPLLTPTPATFTGTITPNTNGQGAVLTTSGMTGQLFPGFQINGVGVTAGTHVASCLPALSFCTGGTIQLDTTYGGVVGPVAMTATNTAYAAVGGFGATPTSNDFTAFPNRVGDKADTLGYATYWGGAIVGEGAGSWNGSQTPYNVFFQASADYAQGVATSNNTLIQNALNVWSADVNGKAIANQVGTGGSSTSNNECGFLSSPSIAGFCNNAPNAVITGTTGNTSTLTVTNVASGTITPGMTIAIGGVAGVPVIQAYGTGGTTGVGGLGTYALSRVYNPGASINNTTIGVAVGVVQGWENIAAAFDGARPVGKANLGIIQYEGSLQQAFCAGSCVVGNISITADPPTLAAQFTANGWNLDPTYGYPGFGAGNLQTATNIVTLFLAYVNSQQYFNDELFLLQSEATIHAARPSFSPAQYGYEGSATSATTGAPQWGLYPGDLSTSPLQNYFAESYFNTH